MEVRSYCLENEWIAAKFVNYGARIASLVIKEKNIDIIHGCGKDQDFFVCTRTPIWGRHRR